MKREKFTEVYPLIAKEWNYRKNGKLDIAELTAGSSRKVWWECSKKHEWEATIVSRCIRLNGCPYCTGQKAKKGETDLATLNPELAKEWNYIKNGNLKPEDVTTGSSRKVWWECSKKHEWEATIFNRCIRLDGCPYCIGQKAIKGETDLATLKPELAKEWNYIKNGNLKPEDVTTGSSRKVWWECSKGHEWEASIFKRCKRLDGCPYCSGRNAIKGETDLATLNPELAKEWNYIKNGDLNPEDVTTGSSKRVWWKCIKGHEWEAIINQRTRGSNCPFCTGKKAKKGETDLATLKPELAKEWNYVKNGDLKPDDVTIGSDKRVWWKCERNHEWKANVSKRSQGRNCPYCTGKKVIIGETDLRTKNPELANEWNNSRNGKLSPSDVTAFSNRKVWWKCIKGHEWRVAVNNRSKGNGCPYCARLL